MHFGKEERETQDQNEDEKWEDVSGESPGRQGDGDESQNLTIFRKVCPEKTIKRTARKASI